MSETPECKHEKRTPIPDSAASVCDQCGVVFVFGEKWDYKSGHISEWVKDYAEAIERQNERPK